MPIVAAVWLGWLGFVGLVGLGTIRTKNALPKAAVQEIKAEYCSQEKLPAQIELK